MAGPLDGVRIIDLTTMISGPFATMLLGDQGADVIKVERPEGDDMRHWGLERGGFTTPFLNNNRNKRSIVVDLRTDAGRSVIARLVETADVVIQNFRPGVVEKLGVDEVALRAIKPDLIYVSISGFGDTGPLSGKPAYDPIIQATSGLATIQGGSDEARPRMVRAMLPDKIAALSSAQAVTAALYARATTGRGQHVKLSMLDTILSFLWSGEMDGHTFVGDEVEGPESISPFDLIYETGDGYICVATVTDRQFTRFADAVGHPEWLQDPRFATAEARERNRTARLETMQSALRDGTTDHWLERLAAADVPSSRVHTRREVVAHPHIAAADSLVIFDHPDAGPIRQAGHPARFDVTEAAVRRPPPALGQHTDEVLREAGFGDSEVDTLRSDGVVA